MSVIAVVPAREAYDEVAPQHTHRNGRYCPYGLSGILTTGTDILCPECASETELAEGEPIFGDTEWDAPGAYCYECGRSLQVDLLVYDEGPGDHLPDELVDEWRL